MSIEEQKSELPKKLKKLKKKDYTSFYEILRLSSGMIATACKKFHISRDLVYARMEQDPEFKEGIENVKESVKDFGEAALLNKIREGDTAAIIFYAKTQLKDRGYTERHEIVGKDGEAIETQSTNINATISMSLEEIDAEIDRLDKLDDE